MIEFGVSFVGFVLATFVPIFVGMFLVVALSNATRVDTRYLSAYALGLMFWFFFDTLNDAAQLDVNQGYSFGLGQILLMLLFIVGFMLFTVLGGRLSSEIENSAGKNSYPLFLTILVALGMGCHGLGEGIEFGGLVAGTQATSVLDAIGGIGGGVSYGLHKLLESTIVIVAFIALSRASGLPFRKQLWQTVIVGLAFGVPSAIGEVAGYSFPIDSPWFYALGAGAAFFVVLQVIRPIFALNKEDEITYAQWVRISVAMLLGFLLFYAAALFHS